MSSLALSVSRDFGANGGVYCSSAYRAETTLERTTACVLQLLRSSDGDLTEFGITGHGDSRFWRLRDKAPGLEQTRSSHPRSALSGEAGWLASKEEFLHVFAANLPRAWKQSGEDVEATHEEFDSSAREEGIISLHLLRQGCTVAAASPYRAAKKEAVYKSHRVPPPAPDLAACRSAC